MSVFISGASSGIGEACARAFAAAKHDLILVARRTERLIQLKSELIEQFQIKVDIFHLDVRNRNQLTNLIAQNAGVFDTIEIVLNNAGLAKGLDRFQDGKVEDWDIVIDTNVKGLLYLTRALIPGLIAKKRGHIINIGSVAGHWVYEKGNVYCASKFAVRAINEALRMDLQGTGIRVTEISPGMVETEFSEVRFSGDHARARSVYAGRKPLTPQDIADTVLWCAQRPTHVNIQEVILFPTSQASVHSGVLLESSQNST